MRKFMLCLSVLVSSLPLYAKSFLFIHPYWEDKVEMKDNRMCRTQAPDCGTFSLQDKKLTVQWDKWSRENFILQEDQTFVHEKITNYQPRESIEEQYEKFEYTLKDPFIRVNPYRNNPLTALIKFATPRKARITLTVHGRDGAPDITHTFDTYETEHTLPVLGLYANFKNQVTLKALFENNETEENTVSVQTENTDSRAYWIVTHKADKAFNYYAGYTGHVYDEQGYLRYYLREPDWGWHHVYFFKDKVFVELPDKIYRYSVLGEKEKEYHYPPGFYTYIHGIGHKPNGNLLVFGSFKEEFALIDGQKLPTHRDFVLELDYETGAEKARYDLAEMLNPDRSLIVKSSYRDQQKVDWSHANGISYDALRKAVIVGGRHFGIAKIDEKTKKLIWWFTPHQQLHKSGRNGQNGPLYDKVLTAVDSKGVPYSEDVQKGIAEAEGFKFPFKTHNITYAGDSLYSLFDNSGELYDKNLKATPTSFAAVYKIDDDKRTVRQIFSKNLNHWAETGSIVTIHPTTREIYVEMDNMPYPDNARLSYDIFMRLDPSGKELYRAMLLNHHFYAVVPFTFYGDNTPIPTH